MLYDAHNHLQDQRLAPFFAENEKCLKKQEIQYCVVNGTHPDDWESVAILAEKNPDWILPAFGIHPWRVKDSPANALQLLQGYLKRHSNAAIGECGLDLWISEPNLPAQLNLFEAQLHLASITNKPISIHCLKAWNPLLESLKRSSLPARGIHIHGFSGSWEIAKKLLDYGAYFSFCGYFLYDKKAKTRAVFCRLPEDRLLIETDAPDMVLPPEYNAYPLPDQLNAPANLKAIYTAFAELKKIPETQLLHIIQQNFQRYFVNP